MFRLRGILLFILICCLLFCISTGAAAQEKVAIFNLRPTNIEAMGYNGDILYALISTLEGEKAIAVMPRREMEEILFHAGIVQGDDPELVHALSVATLNGEFCTAITTRDALGLCTADAAHLDRVQGN